ncbi:MAG: DUF4416 family protein [Candidatus Omnitrophota bacterium]
MFISSCGLNSDTPGSKAKKFNKVKLFIGFIYSKEDFYLKAKYLLIKKFGRPDFESKTLPFIHTRYYEEEFGTGLKRKFLSFAKLIKPEKLAKIKISANKTERKLAVSGKRLVNIDPGILSLGKVILATTKDYKHRVFLSDGIYAESTLYYQDKSFRPWEWTYPDYKTPEYIQVFNYVRNLYSCQISP